VPDADAVTVTVPLRTVKAVVFATTGFRPSVISVTVTAPATKTTTATATTAH
jgi:hypothetical protein